jgi:hypothetical protein
MAIKRVTVSVPEDLAARISTAAGGRSVSAYIAKVLGEHLETNELERLWREYVGEVGISADDIAAADDVLDELTAGPSRRAS